MKPLLAVFIEPERGIEPDYVADVVNVALDREFGRSGESLVSVRTLAGEEDLRSYLAGEMVLYRKPARRRGNQIIYKDNAGQEHRLVQQTAFPE